MATKLAIEKYGDAVEIYYNDTGSEHEDNARFMRDCEAWFGRKVNVLRSEKYANIWEVFEARRFRGDNTERIIECPLIDKHLTKEDCLGMLERVGIEISMASIGTTATD